MLRNHDALGYARGPGPARGADPGTAAGHRHAGHRQHAAADAVQTPPAGARTAAAAATTTAAAVTAAAEGSEDEPCPMLSDEEYQDEDIPEDWHDLQVAGWPDIGELNPDQEVCRCMQPKDCVCCRSPM